jgi:hypothetical protein
MQASTTMAEKRRFCRKTGKHAKLAEPLGPITQGDKQAATATGWDALP